MRHKSFRVRVVAWALFLVLCASLALAAGSYHGNVNSHVFHRPGCRYYNCKNCIREFSSREEAIQAGYRPCKVCNP